MKTAKRDCIDGDHIGHMYGRFRTFQKTSHRCVLCMLHYKLLLCDDGTLFSILAPGSCTFGGPALPTSCCLLVLLCFTFCLAFNKVGKRFWMFHHARLHLLIWLKANGALSRAEV